MIPEAGLLPDLSRTIRLPSEAGLLPECSATIQRRASPGLSEWSPKPGCSRTIRLLPEVGISLSPETAQGLSTKARTYLYDNNNNNVRKGKPSPHLHPGLTLLITIQMTHSEHDWSISPPGGGGGGGAGISPLTDVGLPSIRSQHKLTFPAPTRAALLSMVRVTTDNARDHSRWHAIFPGFTPP